MAAIDFSNLDEWIGDLDKLGQDLYDTAAASLAELATKVTAEIKAAAPKPRDGKRAATITQRAVRGRRRTTIDIGPGVKAFSLVFDEFGTARKPARPFIRPTLDAAWAAWRPW